LVVSKEVTLFSSTFCLCSLKSEIPGFSPIYNKRQIIVLCILIFGLLFINFKGKLSFPLPSKNEKSEVHNILVQFRLLSFRSLLTLHLKGRSQSVWASEHGAEGHTWSYGGGSDRRLEKTASWGVSRWCYSSNVMSDKIKKDDISRRNIRTKYKRKI